MKRQVTTRNLLAGAVTVLLLVVLLGCSSEKTKMYQSKFDKDKQALQAQLQGSIADVDKIVSQLKTRATAATPGVKAQLDRRIQQLDSARTVLNEKLTRLEETTQGQWEQFKSDASKTIGDAESLVKEVPAALGSSPSQPDTASSQ